jgi:dihydrofolate reductase
VRKLVVSEFVSIDGVMEAPGGEEGYPHTNWVGDFKGGNDHFAYKLQGIREAESHLLGRVTYESFAGAWPQRTGEYAEKINAMPKHVVSTTLKSVDWNNSTVIGGDVYGEIARLKAGDGGPILIAGSRKLVHSLTEHDLVDEFRLMIFPVVLGSGFRMFPDSERKIPMKLADSQAFKSGVVLQVYRAEA